MSEGEDVPNQTECAAIARVKKAMKTTSTLIREELNGLSRLCHSLTDRIFSMSTPTAILFFEIRYAAHHKLERLEIHAADEGNDAPTEGELVVMEEFESG